MFTCFLLIIQNKYNTTYQMLMTAISFHCLNYLVNKKNNLQIFLKRKHNCSSTRSVYGFYINAKIVIMLVLDKDSSELSRRIMGHSSINIKIYVCVFLVYVILYKVYSIYMCCVRLLNLNFKLGLQQCVLNGLMTFRWIICEQNQFIIWWGYCVYCENEIFVKQLLW